MCKCDIKDPLRVMNPYLITAAIENAATENLEPWAGEDGGDGDTSGYEQCMWDAVWSEDASEWTQTLAEELLRDAREYYNKVIANVSEQDSQTNAYTTWKTKFETAMWNLQERINGEHWDVGPFAPS